MSTGNSINEGITAFHSLQVTPIIHTAAVARETGLGKEDVLSGQQDDENNYVKKKKTLDWLDESAE